MKHGGELEAMDKMLDHLFEEHGKDNETVRNALQFEMQQIEVSEIQFRQFGYLFLNFWFSSNLGH